MAKFLRDSYDNGTLLNIMTLKKCKEKLLKLSPGDNFLVFSPEYFEKLVIII